MQNQPVCGNTPVLPRRAFLSSLAAAPVAAAATPSEEAGVDVYMQGFKDGEKRMLDFLTAKVGEMNSTTTPIQDLFEKWRSHFEWCKTTKMDDKTSDQEFDTLYAIEHEIMQTPAQGSVDIVRKLVAYSWFGTFDIPTREDNPMLWIEVDNHLT